MSIRQTKIHPARGFTLIEVIISISVLTIAITGAIGLAQKGFAHLEKSQQHQQASYYVHSHFTQLEFSQQLAEGDYSGNYSSEYNWQLQLRSVLAPETNIQRQALSADLVVYFPLGERRFHSLIISNASEANIIGVVGDD